MKNENMLHVNSYLAYNRRICSSSC